MQSRTALRVTEFFLRSLLNAFPKRPIALLRPPNDQGRLVQSFPRLTKIPRVFRHGAGKIPLQLLPSRVDPDFSVSFCQKDQPLISSVQNVSPLRARLRLAAA